MGISRILWPTDFSENAGKALSLVTELAQKFGAEIHILYVMKDYPAFGKGGEGAVRICCAADESVLEPAMERLAEFLYGGRWM
jgi:nucleotide-binding universal stress UspA family protein